MPELMETIARLREELRIAEANGALADLYCGDLRQVLDAAEEVEKLRADKERLELALIRSRTELVDLQSIFYSICNGVYGSEEIMELGYDSFCGRRSAEALRAIEAIDRSLQTHGRGSGSTPEAK